jgi:phage shock protein A
MAQQSILGRVSQLARANIHALLDAAEDPEKMLDQMIRDYTSSINEAEESVATTIGNVRMMEDDHAEHLKTVQEWGGKAKAASRKAEELRGQGKGSEADKFDQLARVALHRQIDAEGRAKSLEPQIESQNATVEKLKTGLDGMKTKLVDLRATRDQLVSRAKLAAAANTMHDAIKSVDLLDPTSEVSRFEEKVRREEAKVRGRDELAASSLDAQFEALDDSGDDAEIEARLAALKTES